jgi:hypothetical protein
MAELGPSKIVYKTHAGGFMPKETRREMRKEDLSAHFKVGYDQMMSSSFYEHYFGKKRSNSCEASKPNPNYHSFNSSVILGHDTESIKQKSHGHHEYK